jgi:hypothetical protein
VSTATHCIRRSAFFCASLNSAAFSTEQPDL